MASPTILVTGGSGFIGSHVVDALADAGHRPRIFDMVPSPFHREGAVDTYIGELGDRDALCDAMEGCDAVMHLAAVADVNQVNLDPVWAEQLNRGTCARVGAGGVTAQGTLKLLERAPRPGVGRVFSASPIWASTGS